MTTEADGTLDLIVGRVQGKDRSRIGAEIEAFAEKLKETGSLFLIFDWDLAYEMKPLVDLALGGGHKLRNEIVWVTRQARASSGGPDLFPGRIAFGFIEKHFTILWYVKDPQLAPFVRLTMPRSLETRKRFGDGRIVSSVSLRTGRRAPARVEGESSAAPLNDVWVWDQDRATWVFELEEMDGRVVAAPSCGARTQKQASAASGEEALYSRLAELAGSGSKSKVLKADL